jgi:hypothetical protein
MDRMTPLEHNLVGVSILTLGVGGVAVNAILSVKYLVKVIKAEKKITYNPVIITMFLSNLFLCLFAFPLSGSSSFKHR